MDVLVNDCGVKRINDVVSRNDVYYFSDNGK